MTTSTESWTWEVAEKIFPGVREEWNKMCGSGDDFAPPIESRDDVDLSFIVIRGQDKEAYLRVVPRHTASWFCPPEWRRWLDGIWTHPIPLRTNILLPDPAFDQLTAAIDNPPEPSAKLVDLFRK